MEPLKALHYSAIIQGSRSTLYKLNENNLVELISCYKDRNTPIDIKYQIIDRLIEMDLGIKGVKQKELINYKKEMLTELISKSTNEKNKKKYAYELMEIDYNYENLKAVLRKDDSCIESISLSDDNLALLDSYNTNNSIKELLE